MRTKPLVVFLIGMFLMLLASSSRAEMRKWTKTNGEKIEAEFVNKDARVVTLRKADGTEITVRMPHLSDEDQKYVKEHKGSQAKPEAKVASEQKPAAQPAPAANAEEPKHGGKKKHGKKPHGDDTGVAKAEKPASQPEEPASDQPKTMIVEAKGSGKDRDEALKDAFRDAVRKVVGAYVEQETVVRNDQVIKDQVLTYSGGCVKTHGILSEDTNGGIVQIAIWALVEQDKVVKHLRAASVTVREFPGKDILDQLVTRRAKEKAAQAMLRSVLQGFPGNCVKAVVDGEPEEVKHDDRGVTIRMKVRCEVDADAFAAFRQRLQSVLHAIAEKEDEGFWELQKRDSGLWIQERRKSNPSGISC